MSETEHPDHWRLALKKGLAARVVFTLIRLIGMTLRMKMQGWDQYKNRDSKVIFCGWHGKSFMFANQFRKRGYWVIISNSNDGDIQNKNFLLLGFKTIRGSTGRGGVRAALSAIRVLREGGTLAISPDGPRGPSCEVQGGVMMMAQKSGASLVPIGIGASPCYRFKSWDRYLIPIPFAKATLIFGDPIQVPADSTPEQVEEIRLHLQNEINRLEALAS
jgi:lysophospholipid acyltransferase (LPLAT)-like uncharacterized protein